MLGAVPGRVSTRMAAGSNQLLRDGAAVIRDASDVLDELFGAGAHEPQQLPAVDLDPVERKLVDAVESGLDVEGICTFAGLPVSEGRAALAQLEARGVVRRDGLLGWEPAQRRR